MVCELPFRDDLERAAKASRFVMFAVVRVVIWAWAASPAAFEARHLAAKSSGIGCPASRNALPVVCGCLRIAPRASLCVTYRSRFRVVSST